MSGMSSICRAKNEIRWMRFVDGENFTIQGTKFFMCNSLNDIFDSDDFYHENNFLWFPEWTAVTNYHIPSHCNNQNNQSSEAIRAYYYIVVVGNDAKFDEVKRKI